jgi:hypothetical protein
VDLHIEHGWTPQISLHHGQGHQVHYRQHGHHSVKTVTDIVIEDITDTADVTAIKENRVTIDINDTTVKVIIHDTAITVTVKNTVSRQLITGMNDIALSIPSWTLQKSQYTKT